MKLVIVAALGLFAMLAVALSVHRYRQPQAAPPEALAHIAEKNRDAAIAAAARQRAESAVTTNEAENLAEARSRGTREGNGDNRATVAGQHD